MEFYWYDYETFGSRPAMDWPAQFAGLRTDADLNEIDEPSDFFCRFPEDALPQPLACIITGLTPQLVNEQGLCEAEFFTKINQEFSVPNTCVVGYNNISFDDEITRYGLYRNFMSPYDREWRNGNSRWDLINIVRLCAAVRPEVMKWPQREDGSISFKLELLTKENNIVHQNAHNALSDVRATISLAKIIRNKQPKMFNYLFKNRTKQSVSEVLNIQQPKPVLYVSAYIPALRFCLAIVMPIAFNDEKKREIIVCDLQVDPEIWINDTVDDIKKKIFLQPSPLYKIRLNQCPVLAPFGVLREQDLKRLRIDYQQIERNYHLIKDHDLTKVQNIFSYETAMHTDPDTMLYSGGFFSRHDLSLITRISQTSPEDIATEVWDFEDDRLQEMLFRYRARNWLTTLNDHERQKWRDHCRSKLQNSLVNFKDELNNLLIKFGDQRKILNQLNCYALEKEKYFGIG